MPVRSALYHLPVQHSNSPQVESQAGYVARLAEAYAVPVQVLVREVLGPILGKRLLQCSNHAASFLHSSGHTLNGKDTAARDVCAVLGQLTGGIDLRPATFLPWADALASLDLVRKRRAWCPICLEDDRIAERPITERLLWAVSVVTICPDHGEPLHQRCPNTSCGRMSPPLAPNLHPGYCPSCGEWLGSGRKPEAHVVDDCRGSTCQPIAGVLWDAQRIAREVGALLAAPPPRDGSNGGDEDPGAISRFAQALRAFTAPYGRLHAFAKCVRLPDSTIVRWREGRMPPMLRQVMLVAAQLHVPLRAVVTGDLACLEEAFYRTQDPAQEHAIVSRDAPSVGVYTRRGRRRFDAERIETCLRAALTRHEPPALRAIGYELGYSNAYLRKYFPELCNEIVARWRAYREERKRNRLKRSVEEIHRVAQKLSAEGLYPSAVRVLSAVAVPLRLSEPACYDAWKGEHPPVWDSM